MTATTLPRPTVEQTPESRRVAELQQMIRSGRYAGYLDELTTELAKAKAARDEIATLGVTSAWEA